ncbi:glycoside hydrolase domain-containing protein [Nocardioides sp. URHA0020]|uniref:glycoside hydrolase domain-containing protein n=1 Tax=Nocardioides sp. URHA0020 TaxID=1380392 RepID=UPI0006867EC9|nr:glycoside hydrolase domain-containing protein [Nocardioides sp. URHA0020]
MPRHAALVRTLGRISAGALVAVVAVAGLSVVGASEAATPLVAKQARAANVATPGSFTGFGFDQCQAPSQAAMDVWLERSPFLAVGIYIDGDSRACRKQTHLDAAWVSTQLSKGWRLLPITLGPQASCQPRFPRYKDDFRISAKQDADKGYATALRQGRTQAKKSVAAARALGIAARSTLWYDLEGFDHTNVRCRDSALTFLSGWTRQIRAQGYLSGVYSSAGSGILALDNARVNRPKAFTQPDQIWIARWDGVADTSTSYIRDDGWRPHARVKQYQGGHDETWGGVKINIDRNFLDVGRGSVAAPEATCGGTKVATYGFTLLRKRTSTRMPVPPASQVKVLQCLLKRKGLYAGRLHGLFGPKVIAAANAWQRAHGSTVQAAWTRHDWMTLFGSGKTPVLKYGSTGTAVRHLQRAIGVSGKDATTRAVRATGVFDWKTDKALRAWQKRVGVAVSGVAGKQTWAAVQAGRF